nr:outer membrane beta-barrel protein [Aestuariivivens sp. NBU2969]
MKYFFFFLMLSSTLFSFSQSKPFKISGTLITQDENIPLEAATVYLERVKDSSVVSYTITDKNGKFTLEDKTYDANLNLYISYIGFKTYKKNILIDSKPIDLKVINLESETNVLDEIVIRSRAPITIKKDTLEFNVKSFKTKKDANVEDLLKQLPGVEVDQDGKITVNGKDVNKILVNGKPFFGNDPTITTRNLSKEIVEKIQVIDTKTRAQAFTGEEVNSENKTINLTIKKENNKGVFARIVTGAGTDKRYELAGMFNRFNNNQRISVLAGGNNTNSPGFSFGEIRQMFGGGNSGGSYRVRGRSFAGGEGITTSKTSGINYADKYGDKVDVSGDYFYSGSDSNNESSTYRENILADTRFFTESNSKSSSTSDNHKVNSQFEIRLDSTLFISIEPSFNFVKTKTTSERSEESINVDRFLTNESSSSSFVENDAKSFNNEFSITKRYGNKGGFIRVNLNNEISNSDSNDFLESTTIIYNKNPSDPNNPNISQEIVRDQFRDGTNKTKNLSTELTYRLPIKSKELFLDFSYSYVNNNRENELSSFNRDIGGDYTVFDTDLSTDFKYKDRRSTPGVKLSFKNKKLSTGFNVSYIIRTLENEDLLRPAFNIKRRFEDLQYDSSFRYNFSAKTSLSANYSLNNTPPQLMQLQAFENITNPLNTVIGNPNLEPSNRHRVSVRYRSFDFQKRSGFFGRISSNFNNNQVIAKSTIDEDLVRRTTFENVDGNYDVSAMAFYRKRVKLDSLRNLSIGGGMRSSINKNVNFNNAVKYSSKVKTLGPSLNLEFEWLNVMMIRPEYQLSFTNNSYDLEAFEDEEFVFHSFNLSTATFLPKNFEWRNDISYSYNPNIADGFQKSAWFWNATLAYSVLKDKAIVTLKAYDLLDQNTNARRIATANYIEDSQSMVLQQYFMLSFSWKFNSLGSKGEVRERGFHRF